MGDIIQLKTCTKCGEEKPATQEYFNKSKKCECIGKCKDCEKAYQKVYGKKYRLENKEKDSERAKVYNRDNKEKVAMG